MYTNDVCYVCGCQGMTQVAHTRQNSTSGTNQTKTPFFPSLLLVPPAASSKPPSSVDGHVRLCFLCFRLLLEQWKSYEKRKTPLANRQYWLKCCAANRDAFDVGNTPSQNANKSNISSADTMDNSRSPSPNNSTSAHSIAMSTSKTSTANQEARPTFAIDVKSKISTSKDDKAAHFPRLTNKPTCIVCSRGIDSMDSCRRLPAHLVAQITDLKPAISKSPGQPFSANMPGEVLVCDDCFASPSFQTAWLDCCRRVNPPNQTTVQSLQHPLAKRQDQSIPSSNDAMVAMQGAMHGQNLSESQRQWIALYERALLQFHVTGQLDPVMVAQLQQLAAAEALASLHSGTASSPEGTSGPR